MIKILHAEDDSDIREIAMLALDLFGDFDVLQCSSGEEALSRIVDFMPDVVLLDMMMPGLSGRQTLKKIRENPKFAKLPAIFMTARAQHAEIEELLQVGASEVITKPFDPMSLPDQIKEAMQKVAMQ